MSKLMNVWIFADKKEALAELYVGAAELGEKVTVLFAGEKAQAAGEHVYYLGEVSQEKILEYYFPAIIQCVKEEKPDLVMISTSKKGRLLAGVLAAATGTSALVDVSKLAVADGCTNAVHMVYGGMALRTESAGGTAIALVGPGAYAPAAMASPKEINDVPFVESPVTMKCVEKKIKVGEKVNLEAAKVIVGVGRGFAAQPDLKMAEDLAEAIGAEVGCSRPIAEGEGWMDKGRYIGVSGLMLKPNTYFALGISGQIQHMVGVNQARVIVAINKDKNAPIFKQADYGLVADLYSALPALTEKIKANK